MFTIFFINFNYSSGTVFNTLDSALVYAVEKGFESAIYSDKELVASFSPIGGIHRY